jgi:hypothetical protein
LRVLGDVMLRRRERKAQGGWIKVHIEKLHNL